MSCISAIIQTVIAILLKGIRMKAYYLGRIETPNAILKRNREHDFVVGRALRMVKGDKEAQFALFNDNHKTVIVVDDGIATGNTMLATLALIRQHNPKKIIVALPVAPADSLERVKQLADEVICLEVPAQFRAVSQFYRDFKQVEDERAIKFLQEANQ